MPYKAYFASIHIGTYDTREEGEAELRRRWASEHDAAERRGYYSIARTALINGNGERLLDPPMLGRRL